VFAVTCPARAPHVSAAEDVHLCGEARTNVTIGGRKVHLTGDLAGLAKLEAMLRSHSDIHATCLEASTYFSRKTIMWVAVYRIGQPAIISPIDDGLFSLLGFPSFAVDDDRRRDLDYHTLAGREEGRIEDLAQHLNDMTIAQGFRLEDGPSAATLEAQLRGVAQPSRPGGVPIAGREDVPINLAFERQRREERREWDFLCAVYSLEDANNSPCIHPLDRAAYAEYKKGYNLDCLRFDGSMLAVDALMSDEPHLRGIGARVMLSGLEAAESIEDASISHAVRQLRGLEAAALNGRKGRIIFEEIAADPHKFKITVKLDSGQLVKVPLRCYTFIPSFSPPAEAFRSFRF